MPESDPFRGAARPVVILGAARSGTKLLRSIIAAADELAPVPHDVNYVWRYGSRWDVSDALPPESATPAVRRFVRAQLVRMSEAGRVDAAGFVEKTVSNCLRVGYVDRVLPEARYVHLVRDGYEVTRSAMKCWRAPVEPRRLLSKLRRFPWAACGPYAFRQGIEWARRYAGGEKQLRCWGPRYPGIERDVEQKILAEVCALQWRTCVEQARAGLSGIDRDRWIEVRYSDLLADPYETGRRIGGFLRVEKPLQIAARAAERVSPAASDSSPELSESELNAVSEILQASPRVAARRPAA